MKTKPQNKKIAVISGGTGYLGGFIAQKLIDEGFVVILIGKKSKKSFLKTNHSNSMFFLKTDIANAKSVERASKEVEKKFGAISVLVHAASAPLIRKPVLDLSLEDFQSQFSVNVTGAFNLFKYFLPIVMPDGTIIGITTKGIETEKTRSASGSYLPAKYALKSLLGLLSDELKEKKIRVYAIAPAFMPGGLNNDIPEKVRQLIVQKSEPEEVAKPEDVARLVIKLINNTSKNMNGKSVTVPEGFMTNL